MHVFIKTGWNCCVLVYGDLKVNDYIYKTLPPYFIAIVY